MKWKKGLVDYVCTQGREGKFVKISKSWGQMVICEAKVFVRKEHGTEGKRGLCYLPCWRILWQEICL